MGTYLQCDDHDVHIGVFMPCGTAAASGGVITTSAIDRFTWIGLSEGATVLIDG